ncbi:hypothetical protein D3C76_153260 [compost metagenome]
MPDFQPPLSIIFVWHPADDHFVKPTFEYCYTLLSRDINKPFSRSMNLPFFYRTTTKKGVPKKIELLSAKTIIFMFISKEIVADDSWIDYINHVPTGDSVTIIPIALDTTAFNLLVYKNFIRAYEYNPKFIKEYLFIAIAHEIYRCSLNDKFTKITLGKDSALNLFLSHAKDGKDGIKLAKALKDFIDGSSMRNFFDATDIAPGYTFEDEIVGQIIESTIIAIHTDSYSSRYWCQREILCAKENNRPIIAVDSLEEYEDRRFPYASNIPGIHINLHGGEPTEEDLLRILSSALLETIRFFYSDLLLKQYKHAEWIKSDAVIISRPPEVSDLEKLLFNDGKGIEFKNQTLVYPEPPVYFEEINFLSKLGIEVKTPLSLDFCPLNHNNIGISISEPLDEELLAIGQTSVHLVQLSQDLARHLISRGANLIYGGDLREDGFTEFIFNETLALQARMQLKKIKIVNFVAWPIFLKDTIETKNWKAKYRPIAQMTELPPPEDVKDLIPNKEVFLPPTSSQNLYVWSKSLTDMRYQMIKSCNVRICVGGKHTGYKGRIPGVLEEVLIALEMKLPLFLLGGFGGVTASVCKIIQNKSCPIELSDEWQIENNAGYKDFLDFCKTNDHHYIVNYDSIFEKIKDAELNNGLSVDENIKLFNTSFIDEALQLVFKGLKNIYT